MKTTVHETHSFKVILSSDTRSLPHSKILRSSRLLRRRTDSPRQQGKDSVIEASESDDLYRELEQRYGDGFAQWVIRGLPKQQRGI